MDNNFNMDNKSLKEELSNSVREYLNIDEEIKKLNIAIKERRLKMKMLSGMILDNMSNNDIHHINIKNGVLVYKETESFKGLSKKTLLDGLSIYFNNNEDKTSEAAQTVLENRPKVKKVSLKLQRF